MIKVPKVMIFIFRLMKEVDTRIMTLQLKSYTACYGNTGMDNFLQPSCATEEKMAVVGLSALAKKLGTSCPVEITISNVAVTPDTCCHYDTIDCSMDHDNSLYRNYYEQCNGKAGCIVQVSWVPTTCNKTVFLDRTNYMKLDYYCIFDQGQDPCSDLSTKDSRVFLWNSGYPSSSLTRSLTCTCSVEASCDSTVMLSAIDLRLGNSTVCGQSIIITDGSTVIMFDCRDNNDYLPKKFYVSTSHFIQIQIVDNLGFADGYYFILIEGVSTGAELTLSCGSTSQVTPTVPFTSLPDCPRTHVTTETTITPFFTFTKLESNSSIKNTNVQSMTISTVVDMDTSTTGVIRAASNTGVTTPNNLGTASDLTSTVVANTKTDHKTIESTSGETIFIGTPIENTVIMTKGITMGTHSGIKDTSETLPEKVTNNEITISSSMSTKRTMTGISYSTEGSNSQTTITKPVTINITNRVPVFVSVGLTSTEKDIITNGTFTTISSVSEIFQKTSYSVSEQTTRRNVTDAEEESSPSSYSSLIIGALIAIVVTCTFVILCILYRDKINENCGKNKVSTRRDEEDNASCHSLFDDNLNIINRLHIHQLQPLKRCPCEQPQRIIKENEPKEEIFNMQKTNPGFANIQIHKEQNEGPGIVDDKNVKQKKKKRKQKKFYNKIKHSKLVEFKLKPRSYGKSAFAPDMKQFLADVC